MEIMNVSSRAWSNNSGNQTGNKSSYCFTAAFGSTTEYLITHVSLLVSILGIPANVLAVVVLRRDPMKTTTRVLLMALAIEDLGLIILYSVYYVWGNYTAVYNISTLDTSGLESPLLFLINWCKTVEIYTVVMVSFDRYVAIRFPLRAASLCLVSNALRGLLVVVVVAFLFKLPNLILDYKVTIYDHLCEIYYLKPLFGDRSWHLTFNIVYVQIIDQIFTYAVPLVSLIVFNSCLIRSLRRADIMRSRMQETKSHNYIQMTLNPSTARSADTMSSQVRRRYKEDCRSAQRRNVTMTLIGVVTVFILCETPTSLIFFNSMYYLIKDGREDGGGDFMNTMYPCALILMIINCSSNFFVYVLIGRKFRNLFLKMFCRRVSAGSGLRVNLNVYRSAT